MAESFSIKAILSAADKGFTSAMKSASGYVDNLKSSLTGGIGFGVMMAAGEKAFDVVSNGITGLIGGMNEAGAAWKTFQGNMEMNGKTAEEIKSIKSELQDFAEATIYSSSDMASTFAQLEAVGTKNTTKLVKGFGGLAAAAESPTQAMKTLSQQATQMAAKPTVAWEDFKLILEQTPAGVAAVAKQMGKSTQQLIKDVQAGTVATEDFFDAIATVGTNDAFTKLATEYKTVGQAMDGLQETMANKLQPAFDVLSTVGINAVSKLVDKMGELDGEKIASKLTSGLDKVKPYWDAIAEAAEEVGSAFGSAISAISGELSELNGSFGSTESVDNFSSAIDVAANSLKGFAGFLEDHADTIALLIDHLPQLLAAYMAFKTVKAVAPGLISFSGAILGLAGKGISGLAQKLLGISKATRTVGNASSISGKMLMQSSVSFLAFGAGIAIAAAGLYVMAQAAIQLAGAGPGAVAVMVGMVAAMAGLAYGASIIGTQLTAASAGLVAFGAAVLIAGTGLYLMASASINLVNAGTPAIAVMAGMVVAMAGIMALAAVLGPALTAGAIGFVAFGVAILAVSVSALIASAALAVIAAVLPTVAEYGLQGAVSIAALGASMIVFAAGAAAAGVASAVLGAGLLVVGAAVLVASAGMLVLAAGTIALGAGLVVVAASVTVAAAAFPLVASGATASAAAFAVLLISATALSAIFLAMTVSMAAFAVSGAASAVAMTAFALAMLTGAAGVMAMSAALGLVNSSMKSIATNAKTAQKSITSMKSSLSIVNEGLDALGNKAKSAVNSLISSFTNSAGKAKSAGQKVGDGINNGVKSGLDKLPGVAQSAMGLFNAAISSGGSRAVSTASSTASSIVSALNTARSGAYSAGYNIGAGLARGMSASLGEVRSIATQLAAEAERAIRAKAQIHSPSKVTDKLGQYFGEGWINRLYSMVKESKKAALELVSIPSVPDVPIPSFAGGYGGGMELNSDYSYTKNAKYTIIVPVEIDGKETARVTAPYTEAELEKRDKLNKMINGIR